MVVFCKIDVFGESSSIRARVVGLGQGGCNRVRSYCNPEKVVSFGQKWLYFIKVVVFGQE